MTAIQKTIPTSSHLDRHMIQCPACETEFQSTHWRRKYCSTACKKRAEYQRDRPRIIARVHAWYEAQRQYVSPDELEDCLKDPRKARTIAGPDVIVCLECGEKLETLSRHLGPAHGMTAAEYTRKPGPDGQTPRYNSKSSLMSTNLRKELSATRKRLRLGHRLAGHRPSVQRLIESRGPRKMSLEYRLDRKDAMSGKGRRDLWKKTPEGRLVTDTLISTLRLQGMKIKDIAQRVGIKGDGRTLHMRLRRMGFPPGRPCLFEHGAPLTGRHLSDLCSDFGMTKKKMAEEWGVSYKTLVHHSAASRSDKPLPVYLAKLVLKTRPELMETFHNRSATKEGGRLPFIPLSERVSMYARHHELVHDLKIFQKWLNQQGGDVKIYKAWEWLCERSRDRTIRLLFWPEFLKWVTTDSYIDTKQLNHHSGGKLTETYTLPQVLAQQFLANSYHVGEKTIRRTLARGDPEYQATIRQVQPLLEDSLTILAGAKAIASKGLVKALKKLDHSRWKDLTPIKLSQELGLVGVKSRTVRLPGGRVAKGYTRKDLERALRSNAPP